MDASMRNLSLILAAEGVVNDTYDAYEFISHNIDCE
jgi:hypothetical protein